MLRVVAHSILAGEAVVGDVSANEYTACEPRLIGRKQKMNPHIVGVGIIVLRFLSMNNILTIGVVFGQIGRFVLYFIGEKDCWGKGLATDAIGLVAQFAFDVLGLYKLNAGTYAGNVGSQKALEKNGFVREGVLKKQVLSEGGRREDVFRFGLLREVAEK